MGTTGTRAWRSEAAQRREADILDEVAELDLAGIGALLDRAVARNRDIHTLEAVNLNPATNLMNPRAEAMLAAGLGSRPSLGHPGEKYEMGLEAIEEIEVVAAELARRVFGARHAEVRVGSGALANLYGFMATCRPGDAVIVPPASIAGHVTHQAPGAAGLYGLEVHEAPVDAERYTLDVPALAELADRVRPRLITVGGSLNLHHHPVAEVREVADAVGARVLFDAAHLCGVIAGGAWPDPLAAGADLVTMSTYKSLGGPPAGLVLTDDDALAERIESIAYPGLTANFDVANTAALAVTLLDWLAQGPAYAEAMVATASALAEALEERGAPVYRRGGLVTRSHAFALDARGHGGGQTLARRLREANLLTSGIGLPVEPLAEDVPGLRLGTPELVRFGAGLDDVPELADLVAEVLTATDPAAVAPRVTAFRSRFTGVHFTTS